MRILIGLCLLFPLLSYSAEPLDFKEYSKKIDALTSMCSAKDMPSFSGFCLSQKYEKETTTSITVALQLISYEDFYRKCDHSDFTDRKDLLAQSLKMEDTEKFYQVMQPQQEAVENYSKRFNLCKTKTENDSEISKRLQWFEWMQHRKELAW